MILRAVDRGINYFDTAPDYGRSEEYIGEALKKLKRRDRLYIASKFCDHVPYEAGVSRTPVEEHVAEAARVLSRYCDAIGIRAFPKFQDWSFDRTDPVLSAFAEHASVPVFNMETITHPFQELALIRWLAPGLLGIPVDLQIVRTSDEVVPFFENVFRPEHRKSGPFLLNDPYTVVRARPLYGGPAGPTDLLGFRNSDVPNRADVVAIGDSSFANVGRNKTGSQAGLIIGLASNDGGSFEAGAPMPFTPLV